MKKVILTGATGFVGNAVLRELIKNNIEVIALGRKDNPKNIPQNKLITYIKIDLDNIKNLTDNNSVKNADTFFNFAWSGVDTKERKNEYTQYDNVKKALDCLYVAKEIGCRRFIGIGSIMEKEALDITLINDTKPNMSYVYGASKLYTHMMSKAIANKIGVDFIWCEITNTYGVGEINNRLISSTLQKIIKGEELNFTEGQQNYNFIYIDDVARAFYLIGIKGKPFSRYLIGGNDTQQLKNYLLIIKDIIAKDKIFNFGVVPYNGSNLSLDYFDFKNLEDDTGFKPKTSFKEGIEKTFQWLLKEYKKENIF
ncbi:NAD(P)-dependent oxidoreductase [Megamonas hypermegale]|uniref:NAD-dependent epimerase/dehydratase family protein n=1 Tax=Megamonas hypermegale TaxID=158847 RepID=UPI0026EEBB0B|nr:NAD-dependent epimerase/dehydratase family protein [Megamonas hypermegale]